MRTLENHNEKKYQYLNSLVKTARDNEFQTITQSARNDAISIGKGAISISYFEANCLHQIIKQQNITTFIELGSLTGFSACFILNALNEAGKLYCFEKEKKWIPYLKKNLSAILKLENNSTKSFEIIEGDAIQNLQNFTAPIDGIFIDANKSAYLDYLMMAEKILKPGGLLIADNVFLDGTVWGAESPRFSKKQVEIMTQFNKKLFEEETFSSFFLDTYSS